MKVEQRRAIAKAVFAVAFLALTVLIVSLWVGCSSTVIPTTVESREVAYDGNEQTAGVLKVWPGRGALLSATKKAEYDALVARYGDAVVPEVKKGAGLTKLRGKDEGFPLHEVVWHIDAQHLEKFMLFKGWLRAGR